MSHRNDCPTEWEARRQGARAFENGRESNPYRDGECEEAARSWRSGWLRAEQRQLEEDEERRYYEAEEYARAQAEHEASQCAQMQADALAEQPPATSAADNGRTGRQPEPQTTPDIPEKS